MVTVSHVVNNQLNNPVKLGSLMPISFNSKNNSELTFQAKNSPHTTFDKRKYKEDTVLENNFTTRLKNKRDKILDLPFVTFPRGLKGAPDFTFYEFLQTAKFPYYVGGPILASLFYAGVKKDSLKSAAAASKVAKHMALGVGLYYLGAAFAKSIINTTVKLTRGFDLNHPYAKAVSTSTNQSGAFAKGIEYHSLYESADFTRTDLLYNKHGKTLEEINAKYIELGKKFGVKGDPKDIDQTVKPLIKKTIIMSRAWQYALTAFFVTLGIGMANQPAWGKTSAEGFKRTLMNGVLGKNIPLSNRLQNTKIVLYDYILKPFGKSFKEFWKGQSKASSIAGKSVILATAAATLTAIMLIANKTSAKNHNIPKDNKSNEVNK